MRRFTALALVITFSFSLLGAAPNNNPAPDWKGAGQIVFIFGMVDRPGYYALPKPTALERMIGAAGLHSPKGLIIVVHRPMGNLSKSFKIDADRLRPDGQVLLEPNDVVEVLVPHVPA